MSAVYLTARWGRRDEMRLHREALVAAGHSVTSRWLDEEEGAAPAEAAQVDLDDIHRRVQPDGSLLNVLLAIRPELLNGRT